MGWSGGSVVFKGVIEAVKADVPDEEARVRIYTKAITAFDDADWDSQGECIGLDPAYDRALRALSPYLFEDEA